ncbi:MAG TPA: hypothetical protein VMJ10_10735 [Kofleriaceae bacterium]|nr:hypothetical protein [Kofleriaceae bacterium]
MHRLALVLALVPAAAFANGPKGGGGSAKSDIKTTGATTHNLGACGARVLPLTEGNVWTYGQVLAPLPPDDKVKRISPPQAKTIVITVKSIDAKKGSDTVVTLEEKITTDLTKEEKKPIIDERTITTTITCSPTKFEISPDSFFFAGEPGGYIGVKLDSFDRSRDTSWKLINGGIGDKEWREDIVAKWERVPTPGSDAKLGSGKLELERRFQPQQPEVVITKLGTYHAEKLALTTTGRVTNDGAEPDAKPMELPAGWLSTIWMAEGVGVVQVLNPFAHQYQLMDAQLK